MRHTYGTQSRVLYLVCNGRGMCMQSIVIGRRAGMGVSLPDTWRSAEPTDRHEMAEVNGA